ncbi:hypothetical protein [Bacillus atrophaeus]|uniref:hypothetical protein n=1 Tax=Bacillus atrophaeus TaxID=1452 RepID=UPI002280BDD9|nr:hypothetical protein [Bacillus atrophaeus]MCY8922166.1 hypothetical protein [Bacillus atrophaeus]MCY8934458.1 hypothetical protein [Bacillus atrophaeus]MED4817645.1 hypothetical protein [Bacillus atrophaeus]MED4825810.1 hypothetical protein [Bacillus atrophaeus]MED4828173.1 hypothetical protein [Bacillus atrophaeus]
MELKIGQEWISEKHPHENFKIYGGIVDTCVDSFKDESIPFDEQPEGAKIFFWERTDNVSFNKYVESRLGSNRDSTHPFARCGESKKSGLIAKIKKFNMTVKEEGE